MGFSRQEYWSGLSFPAPGDLPDPGLETASPALQANSLLTEPPGKPYIYVYSLWFGLPSFMSLFIHWSINIQPHSCLYCEELFKCHHWDEAVLALDHRSQHLPPFFFFHCCLFFFFPFIFISWRLITLQYCSGVCHTLTWISHGFTCVPHPTFYIVDVYICWCSCSSLSLASSLRAYRDSYLFLDHAQIQQSLVLRRCLFTNNQQHRSTPGSEIHRAPEPFILF